MGKLMDNCPRSCNLVQVTCKVSNPEMITVGIICYCAAGIDRAGNRILWSSGQINTDD